MAFSGKQAEYALATPFFAEIIEALHAERSLQIHVAVVPGNHDCDFARDGKVRPMLIKGVLNDGEVDNEVIAECTKVQEDFFLFRDALEGVNETRDVSDRLWRTTVIEVGGDTIYIDAINVAWLSSARLGAVGLQDGLHHAVPQRGQCDVRIPCDFDLQRCRSVTYSMHRGLVVV